MITFIIHRKNDLEFEPTLSSALPSKLRKKSRNTSYTQYSGLAFYQTMSKSEGAIDRLVSTSFSHGMNISHLEEENESDNYDVIMDQLHNSSLFGTSGYSNRKLPTERKKLLGSQNELHATNSSGSNGCSCEKSGSWSSRSGTLSRVSPHGRDSQFVPFLPLPQDCDIKNTCGKFICFF